MHQAFTYANVDEFTDVLTPFVRDGLQAGELVGVVTGRSNLAALREALGHHASAVDFYDAQDWYSQPYQTMGKWARYVDEHAAGRRARLIGEPVWEGRSTASIREWTRYESAINIAFADTPAWLICPYNKATLPQDITAHAWCTHPEVVDRGGPRSSPQYLPPADLFQLLSCSEAPPHDADTVVLDAANLSDARRRASRKAEAAGLSRAQLGDWTLAVSELLTNGVKHGRAPVRLRLWRDGGELVTEVKDPGNGITDHLHGCTPNPPSPDTQSGRGLWLVRQLADSVDFCRSSDGFTVRIRFRLCREDR